MMLACSRYLLIPLILACATHAGRAVAQNTDVAPASDAHWVWSPAYEQDSVPAGVCYFRKTFDLERATESAVVHIAADNRYELAVNGEEVGGGGDWRKMDTFDIASKLRVGKNVIAVRAHNTEPGPAGLVARVLVRPSGATTETYSTDDTWKTSVKQFRGWTRAAMNDDDWLAAKAYGPLGTVLPWGNEVVIAAEGARFTLDPEFRISRVASDDVTGSIIAMTFTGAGDLLVSQERGPLLLLTDKDKDGYFESRTVFSDRINSAQGILSVGGQVFAVGPGPDGPALYRLVDNNRDGAADEVTALVKFRGSAGEHGPHAVRLGPDGMLYVMCGNFARVDAPDNPKSPYRSAYEGDVVTPRYEDPRGHAVGVPAPGGTLLRTDFRGQNVEVVAGGLRNAYDFAFNEDGEPFTYDADMEWDRGTPWYRPTRINHVPAGAEFGWRSGWAKWPDYWLDSLPATLDIGPGSPTGVEFYSHNAFPVRFQNTLLAADWARGEVHAVKLRRAGGGYRATSSVLLKGRPMAVTDLAVGPDGALYASTGGRGAEGAVYRIAWKGKTPPEATDLGKGIDRALRQPQLDADWARTQVALVRRELGQEWGPALTRAALDPSRRSSERLRALVLMNLYGPRPTTDALVQLTRGAHPELRMAAARTLGRRREPAALDALGSLLEDGDASVRRVACESLAMTPPKAPSSTLAGLMADDDRFVRFAARRAMEKIDPQSWRDAILAIDPPSVFLHGAVALLTAAPDKRTAMAVLSRCERLIGQQLAERDYLDLLRVIQLAMIRGQIEEDELPSLKRQLVAEYPTADARMNRELVRLLVRLQAPEAAAAMSSQLQQADDVEKLHIGAYASHLQAGWSTPEKLALLRYYEEVRGMDGGYSAPAYIEQFARRFFTNLTLAERRQVLASGDRFPTSALSILAKLPEQPGAEILAQLRELDTRVAGVEGDAIDRLRVGVVAVLARSNEAESVEYLHQLYEHSPERRAPIAMALTQHPEGANWPVLIDALKTLEATAAREVLTALQKVRVRPSAATPYRNVILQGLRPDGAGPEDAHRLLSFWIGAPGGVAGATTPDEQILAWQAWYAGAFPDEQPAELPKSAVANRWSYEELLSFLDSPDGRAGDASHGRSVFDKATCIKCHRHGARGERIGPDLSTLARRFQVKEVLESVVYPSHVVSDQYATKVVVADGKSHVGVAVASGPDEVIVLNTKGDRVTLARDQIESITPSAASAMPEGLLNPLTLEEVADLFAFLMTDAGTGTARQPQATERRR